MRVNTYRLVAEGIEGPLRAGLYRAYKHAGTPPTDQEIDRIVECQHAALMIWLSEAFYFDDEGA